MQRRALLAHAVGDGGDRGEIGLGLRELRRERVLHLLMQRAAGLVRRLRLRDRRVEHPALRRVEVELRLRLRDHLTDFLAAPAHHAVVRAAGPEAVAAGGLSERGAGEGEREGRGRGGRRAPRGEATFVERFAEHDDSFRGG